MKVVTQYCRKTLSAVDLLHSSTSECVCAHSYMCSGELMWSSSSYNSHSRVWLIWHQTRAALHQKALIKSSNLLWVWSATLYCLRMDGHPSSDRKKVFSAAEFRRERTLVVFPRPIVTVTPVRFSGCPKTAPVDLLSFVSWGGGNERENRGYK